MAILLRAGVPAAFFYALVTAAGSMAGEQAPAALSPAPSADQLVREALENRLLGRGDSDALLARAIEADPRSEAAHWQSGFVRNGAEWIKYDAVADGDAYRKLLNAYETERLGKPKSLDGQVRMAEWCRDHKLAMQERAHWFKVLEFDADHPNARARLGYVRVGELWVLRTEIESTRRRQLAAEQAFKKWSTTLRPIRLAFESNDSDRMAAAREKLAAIRDPDAIPAMEAMLSRLNLEAATAVVFAIRQMQGPESTVGLARQATFADWYPVGKEAAEGMRGCDELSYVPMMLSALAVPPGGSFKMTALPGDGASKLLVRYEFERERQHGIEKVTYDVSYGVWVQAGTGRLPPELAHAYDRPKIISFLVPPGTSAMYRAMQPKSMGKEEYYRGLVKSRAEMDQARATGAIQEESRLTDDLNRRICRVLRTATGLAAGEMSTDDPRAWWDWWTKRREVVVIGPKSVVRSNFAADVNEEVPRFIPPPILAPREFTGRLGSCLVAGTMIYTDLGPRPVEQIRLGDRVLSQNVETGELSYRVVLEPTTRPAAPTVVLKFGDKTIRATGGHPFWAVGRGWTKAREFEPGMRMATVGGTVEVTGIEPAGDIQPYNLVVDEFHTYFVGDMMVLSHDNTPPVAAHGGLPGMGAR